ncbi:MAG: alpha/beta hydrolase fold domain-containing protein [Acidobacteria bacterium]|nr:alpha/beta hydrolase fold domain-containing protein [Acidobacteriota bacterium]
MRALLLLALAALPFASPAAELKTPDDANRIETYRTVDGYELRLWIYEPEGHRPGDKTPAVVFFFGGGWNNGSPTQFATHAKYLASRGMVAMTADYRVNSRQGVEAKECVVDAKAAMRWIRSHSAQLGIDPKRLAAGGGSAGGHLAAALATLPDHDADDADRSISVVPNALALFNPAVLLAPAPGFEALEKRRAELEGRMGASVESMSPYHHIKKGLPPTIIFHGKEDITVPYASVEAFCDKAREVGSRCELVGYEDAAHGFFNYGRGDNSNYADTLRRTDAFFASLGWLHGAPTLAAPTE